MTVELFMTLLTISAVVTSLVTEAVKRVYNTKSNNLLALYVSLVVGAFVCFVAYLNLGIAFTLLNVLYMLAFIVFNWLIATLGYDKVVQAIKQIWG